MTQKCATVDFVQGFRIDFSLLLMLTSVEAELVGPGWAMEIIWLENISAGILGLLYSEKVRCSRAKSSSQMAGDGRCRFIIRSNMSLSDKVRQGQTPPSFDDDRL